MTITYDDIGNPVLVGEDTYVWEGRKLLSLYDDYEFSNYTYNTDGIRTSKEYGEYDYNGYRHEYTLNGSQIVKETVYYNEYGDSGFVEDYTLVYIYDETGSPIGMKYREPSYAGGVYDVFFFEKNLQGDIVSVYNSTGEKVLSYTYDAWGNFTQTYVGGTQAQIFTAQKNPFRYRGYYYDTDTGLYYLQSRYYNPTWGRFLNADKYVNANGDIVGFNMYAYCSNNPISFTDPSGEGRLSDLWERLKLIAKAFHESVQCSVGLGTGLGIEFEYGSLDVSAVAKADVLYLEKNSGETDVFFGMMQESSVSIEAAGFSIQGGEKVYQKAITGEVVKTEKLEPEFDPTMTIGVGLYFIVGARVEIGFDFVRFFSMIHGYDYDDY